MTDTFCDLNFIQAKCAAKRTLELVKDYNFTLEYLPEAQEKRKEERKRQERMEKYTDDLINYAKGEIKTLDIPKSVKPWSKEKIDAEIERIKINPNRLNRLDAFINFVGYEADNLQNYACEFPYFSFQQAGNYVNSGPVGKAAEKISSKNKIQSIFSG